MSNDESLQALQQLVMLSILQLGEEAYGAAIQQELEERAGRSVTIPTIYVSLSRLERRGLVESWLGDPTPVRGGRAKRFYRVTDEGRDALQAARAELERMWTGLDTGKASR
jgi:DNA-binding PadR family transcriptional regulator